MKKKTDNLLCRRQVLKLGASAAALGVAGAGFALPSAAQETAANNRSAPGAGRVVKVHMPGMRGMWFPHADAAQVMVDLAVTALAGDNDLGAAWSKFVKSQDRVGIKVNCLGGRFSSTMKEVADAVVKGVKAAGVPDSNIMIFDQYGGNMRSARYQWQEKPGRLRVINHDVLGYESDWLKAEGAKAKLSKALTWSTAIINMPVLKDHDLAGSGISCSVKNMVCGCIEKPELLHAKIGSALPHFYAREEIGGKVRLTIADGSFCLYDGGPKHNPSAHASHDCVYASTDPIALDTIALEAIERLRKEKGLRTLAEVGRPATYLKLAEKLGLGIADRSKIRLETIELPKYVPVSS